MGGIYPDVWFFDDKGYVMSLETASYRHEFTLVRKEPGVTMKKRFVLAGVEVKRDDCFCCSCKDDGLGHDPYCRNHGFAAKRPCEVHGMSGSVDDDGVMPSSVQEARKR